MSVASANEPVGTGAICQAKLPQPLAFELLSIVASAGFGMFILWVHLRFAGNTNENISDGKQKKQARWIGVALLLLLVFWLVGSIIVACDWDGLIMRRILAPAEAYSFFLCLLSSGPLLLVVMFKRSAWPLNRLFLLILFNTIVLAIFCAFWLWGFYMSEYWMHIIDLGAPWSWFIALFITSYIASFLPLRKNSKMVLKSFAGPIITAPAFYFIMRICAVVFDPNY